MSYFDDDCEPEELPEYLELVQCAIEKEVQRRLAEENADLEDLREARANYNEAITKAEDRVRQAERKMFSMEGDLEAFRRNCKEKIEKAKKSWFDGFTSRWKGCGYVYVVQEKRVYVKCPICDSSRRIAVEANGVKAFAPCPLCDPNGDVMRAGNLAFGWNQPERYQYDVSAIHLNGNLFLAVENGAVRTFVKDRSSQVYIDRENAFTDEEQAKAYAEAKNAEALECANASLMETIKKKGLEKFLPEVPDAE